MVGAVLVFHDLRSQGAYEHACQAGQN
ncbi:MAG: hypothetical protein RL298_1789, partial [Pseudomonadota bacterium]